MGFPRIISKNNKIYTKLGEFCLSGDGQQFWIVCHTCQEELQTQDNFWKHIQDEHNFMHGIKQEQTRTAAQAYMEAAEAASMMPLPLFRKMSVNEQQREDSMSQEDEDMQKEPKDYTEMRPHEDASQSVSIDIKLEPQLSHPGQHQQHQQQQQQQMSQSQAQQHQQEQLQQTQQQIEISTPLMYQIPHVHAPVSAYAALVQQAPNLNTLNMAAAAAAHQVPTSMAAVMPLKDDMVGHNKESANNSTTASASSAMSSEDGERWYICDFENCGLKFKYQSRLELHRSVHSKERRFSCEICGASFKQSCNLSTHRKKKHALKGTAKMTLVPPHRF